MERCLRKDPQRVRRTVRKVVILKPLVSILIPAFNAQEWIADALHSAITQTWDRKEIIVVDDGSTDQTLAIALDDGSTDQTLAIARQFESDWVRVFTQKNQGASAARNQAFSLSRGDYIQWLDADDLLAPDKITKQMTALEQCGSQRTLLSSAWGQFMYRYNRAAFVPTALWNDLSPVEWLLRKMSQNLHMQTATWLVSRELTEAAGPWNTSLLGDDDGEYFCRVLLQSDGVRFVPEARVYYRACGAGSLSYIGRSDRKREAQWRSMELHIGYLQSLESSSRVRAAWEIHRDQAHFWTGSCQACPILSTASKVVFREVLGQDPLSSRTPRLVDPHCRLPEIHVRLTR